MSRACHFGSTVASFTAISAIRAIKAPPNQTPDVYRQRHHASRGPLTLRLSWVAPRASVCSAGRFYSTACRRERACSWCTRTPANWDFPMCRAGQMAVGMPVRFWGKDLMFNSSARPLDLRWLGGVLVDRTAAGGSCATR